MDSDSATGAAGYVGKSTPQVTAVEKVRGISQYVGDMKMVGLLHAKVLRSPHAHARIVSVDVSRAKAMLGVKAVLTGQDTPARLAGPLLKERRILAADRVRFAGEAVVAVAAIDDDIARDALELVRVEYEELPAVMTPEEALREGAIEVQPGTSNVAYELSIDRGDVDRGIDASAAVYEAVYDMPYQYPGYLEPMGSIAAVDATGRITVWAPTQSVFFGRGRVAEVLDIPLSQVRFVQTTTGGAFGAKIIEDDNTPIAALLAWHTRRPVRHINNRLEDFLGAPSSVPARVWLRMGVSADGELLAKDSIITADNGAYTGLAPKIVQVTAMRSDSMHRLKNVRSKGRLVFTNKIPSGTFRGFGGQQMSFPLNSHLTMLAHMIGMDPVELQLKNAITAGEKSVHGWEIGSCGLSECITRARDAVQWSKKYGKRLQDGPKARGVGISAAIHVSANRQMADWDGSTAVVRVNEDGRVRLITAESDMGQGLNTVLTQICATELGIPMSHITVAAPDTDVAPFGFGSIASRATIIAGNAFKLAARKARRQLLEVASDKMEVAISDLTISEGKIHVVGVPDKSMTIADAARMHIFRQDGEGIYVKVTYDPKTTMFDSTYYGNVAPAYSFAAQAVEVEVDTETGQVKILDSFVSDDCGKALNPMAVHGQTNGASAQAVGWALYEGLAFEDGRLANGNFADYSMPTADSLPSFRSDIVESNDPNGPYGAKGASETAILPGAGAIANAVFDAIGVRINSLPITPEKVLAALAKRRDDAADAHLAKAADVA